MSSYSAVWDKEIMKRNERIFESLKKLALDFRLLNSNVTNWSYLNIETHSILDPIKTSELLISPCMGRVTTKDSIFNSIVLLWFPFLQDLNRRYDNDSFDIILGDLDSIFICAVKSELEIHYEDMEY